MSKRTWTIAAVVVAVPVLAVGWWLGSPLFLDKTVDEEFPMSSTADVPEDMTQEDVEKEMEAAAAEPDTEASDDMPDEDEPISVVSGEFEDYDDFHKGSGTATVYEFDDGSHVLRLENFEVTNGPDLHVLLVPSENPEDMTGSVDLGSLKGNIGDQNYEIPDGINPSEFGSVIIYCQPFHVVFSVATLA